LGLEKSVVVLLPHNPEWIALGRAECSTVRRLLTGLALEVVHVGSTSVPDLDAKPILDIVAAVNDDVQIDDVIAAMTATGVYGYEGDHHEDGGLLFVRGSGVLRSVHVHVVGIGSKAWPLYLRFHDLLLTDVQARQRYQDEKHRLAEEFPSDRVSYTNAKDTIIKTLLEELAPEPASSGGDSGTD
jgi:GrpB-like predicted nucleotidyltransferase (UPF0157 family)